MGAFDKLLKKAGSKGGSSAKGRQAIEKWLQDHYGMSLADFARQDVAKQEEILGSVGDPALQGLLEGARDYERSEAFKRGEILPGVSESGQGTSLDQKGRAGALEAKGIRTVDAAAAAVSDNPADYTYTPETDQGAGYDLSDKITTFGDTPFDELQRTAEQKAIDQVRGDTTGLEGQKFALANMRSNYAQGGLSAIDRARMAESARVREAQARGAREAVQANAAEQGRAGGNLSYLLQSKANQDATTGRAMDDLQTQSLALQRQDAMLRGMGDLGGQMQSADDLITHFNAQGKRDIEKARFEDEQNVNQTNFNEKMGREHADVGAKNAAAATQFGVDTNRSAANTDRTNQGRMYNVSPTGGARGMFRDKLAAAEAAAGQGNTAANLASGFYSTDKQAEAADDAAKAQFVSGIAQPFVDLATGWVADSTKPKKQ